MSLSTTLRKQVTLIIFLCVNVGIGILKPIVTHIKNYEHRLKKESAFYAVHAKKISQYQPSSTSAISLTELKGKIETSNFTVTKISIKKTGKSFTAHFNSLMVSVALWALTSVVLVQPIVASSVKIPQEWLEAKHSAPKHTYKLDVTHLNAQDVRTHLKALFPTSTFSTLPNKNTLLIHTEKGTFAKLEKIIRDLDTPQQKIELTFSFIELSAHNYEDYHHALSDITSALPIAYSLEKGALSGPSQLDGIIHLLNERGVANIKATPKIHTLDKHPAHITIGDKVPFTNTVINENSTSIQVQYIDTGLSIDVTPEIHRSKSHSEISIDINATLSTIKLWREVEQQKFPIISKRHSNTKIRLKNGESAVISGLLDEAQKHTQNGVPILMDIPLIGGLFKQQQTETLQTDMVIIVSARII